MKKHILFPLLCLLITNTLFAQQKPITDEGVNGKVHPLKKYGD